MGFFDNPEMESGPAFQLPAVAEFSHDDLLSMEKEITGLYLTGHPLDPYAPLYSRIGAAHIDQILTAFEEETGEYQDGETVRLLGVVSRLRTRTTRSNATMAYALAEDLFGSMELLIFPKSLAQFGHLLQAGQPVVLTGRLSAREEVPVLVVDKVESAPSPEQVNTFTEKTTPKRAPASRPGLYLRVPSVNSALWKRAELLLAVFDGPEPVYVRFSDSGRMMRLPSAQWVDPNEVLLGELKKLLSEENVVLLR